MKVRLESHTTLLACFAALFCLFRVTKAQAQVTPKSHFNPIGIHMPTHFVPGSANNELFLVASSIGAGHSRRAAR